MIKAKKIKYDGDIKKIFHISDIHIRNLKRHQEYNEVFSKLYKYIETNKTLDSIIVITGDVVHAKTDMTPEVVDMTQNFLRKLSDILPTILIPGNHDANLNNLSRLDALTPIVKALKHPNLFYLKDNGVWKMGNISFGHTSVFSNRASIIPASDIDGGVKIALFHGAVDGVKTEHGFELKNKNINVSSFDGYHMVLLGDIHMPNQELRPDGSCKYPGSLIMQNHSESKYEHHGILVWDVETAKAEFVPIHNDYGYVTIDIDNGNVVTNNTIPIKPRIRVRVNNTAHSDVKKLLSEITINKKVQEISIQKVSTSKAINKGIDNTISYNTRDVGVQNNLIETYLENTYSLPQTTIDLVKQINVDVNSKINSDTVSKNLVWKPKRFEFSNMFSYGTNNVIDFTNMKGAYGIFAANAGGKSSAFDALAFCIFDKCSRTSKASDVLNYSKSSFNCKFNFELNGVDYYIERAAKKSPKRGTVKVDVNFYSVDCDGNINSLNGDERRDTNSVIRQYVGSYEDFVLTSMSIQGNNSGFIEKSQKERKELLAQFLDIDIFEQLYAYASKEMNELSTLLKEYKNYDYFNMISEFESKISHSSDGLIELQTTSATIDNDIKNTTDTILELNKSLINVDLRIIDLDNLIVKKDKLTDDLKSKVKLCDEYIENLNKLNKTKSELDTEFSSYNLDDIKAKHTKYEELKSDLAKFTDKIQSMKTTIAHKTEHLNGIGSLTFDDGCSHCIANRNTPFAKKSTSLNDELSKLKLDMNTLISTVTDIESTIETYNVTDSILILKDLKAKISKCESDIDTTELKLENVKLQKNDLIDKIKLVDSDIINSKNQAEAVSKNKTIQLQIAENTDILKRLNRIKTETTDKIISISSDIKIYENKLDETKKSIDKLKFMEEKYSGYEYYLNCVKRDGIPYLLISEALPKLETEINNILSSIVDFQILLNTDGKNINSYIAYSDTEYWPLELTSGMEKFISSIAIRSALINISNLPRPNFMAIDEGFGTLDVENFNSLYMIFEYLRSQFDFIIIISHIDKTRDMIDSIIDITKVGGFSKINYL
jgi:DNA repair exonuclease SbcCD ATPase subunit/DNA repair exonuclease SbcCD nuclease subunit